MSNDNSIAPPIPIYRVAHRFYIYDVDHVTYIRREHNIIGVLVGTLPQSPQQNVFLGLPQQLLAEEARLLVEQGYAYIVDDVDAHRNGLGNMNGAERSAFKRSLDAQGRRFQQAAAEQAQAKRELALSKLPEAKRQAAQAALEDQTEKTPEPSYPITPTTSHPPFRAPARHVSASANGDSHAVPNDSILPLVPSLASYALYRYLHSKSYFMSSGLRFGAQYSVYPGDPLRFHAHFLARGYEWDEDIDLLSVIGGGRLGTGVKKGFLMGGPIPEGKGWPIRENGQHPEGNRIHEGQSLKPSSGHVRCFCIEWAGM